MKALKYRPGFPGRFGCEEDAVAFCRDFFGWYNDERRHSGIGMLTPLDLHFGRAEAVRVRRTKVLARAYEHHPERFVHGHPAPPTVPTRVWINPPPTGQGDGGDKISTQ